MRALAAALPPGLEVLEISGNELGNEGVAALVGSLKRLRRLNLGMNAY